MDWDVPSYFPKRRVLKGQPPNAIFPKINDDALKGVNFRVGLFWITFDFREVCLIFFIPKIFDAKVLNSINAFTNQRYVNLGVHVGFNYMFTCWLHVILKSFGAKHAEC